MNNNNVYLLLNVISVRNVQYFKCKFLTLNTFVSKKHYYLYSLYNKFQYVFMIKLYYSFGYFIKLESVFLKKQYY